MGQFQFDLLDGAQHDQVHHDGDNGGLCVRLFKLDSCTNAELQNVTDMTDISV